MSEFLTLDSAEFRALSKIPDPVEFLDLPIGRKSKIVGNNDKMRIRRTVLSALSCRFAAKSRWRSLIP